MRYEYECETCGAVTVHGPNGGDLAHGYFAPEGLSGKARKCEGGEFNVTAVNADGEREPMGPLRALVGA